MAAAQGGDNPFGDAPAVSLDNTLPTNSNADMSWLDEPVAPAPVAPATPSWGAMDGAGAGGGGSAGQPGPAAKPLADPDFMDISGAIRQAKHPVAASFHLLFKTGAIVVYCLGSWMPFQLAFVICILCLAFDFWTVKNVTGRLMVGLRWWNIQQEDGTDKWVFESIEDTTTVGKMDKRIFWWGLWLAPAIWGLFFFLCLIEFELRWMIVVVVALMLNMT
eukprot:g2612.t1